MTPEREFEAIIHQHGHVANNVLMHMLGAAYRLGRQSAGAMDTPSRQDRPSHWWTVTEPKGPGVHWEQSMTHPPLQRTGSRGAWRYRVDGVECDDQPAARKLLWAYYERHPDQRPEKEA
jgi:hypothetical protein